MMTEKKKRRSEHVAIACGLLLLLTAGVLTVKFIVSDSWIRARVVAIVVLYFVSFTLLEFGNNGRWFPRFSPLPNTPRIFLRALGAIAGLALLLLALGACFALGSGKWPVTTTGFVFGLYSTSFLLIRYAITGVWLPDWHSRSQLR